MGRYMHSEAYQPALALVSTATRTRQTFALVDAALHVAEHHFERAIYGASAQTLIEVIRATPSSVEALLLVGHNPGMADLSLLLSDRGASDPDVMQRLGEKYPTAGLAVFTMNDRDWGRIGPQSATLTDFVTPRMLGGVDED